MIYKAQDVTEAIKLAEAFMADGKYNWFRGQTQAWRLKTTLQRIKSDEELKEAKEKSTRFYNFLLSTPGLESFAQNVNSFFAIGQHYGLPTNYLDFTTNPKVAGFFATHGKQMDENQDCCIICLDTRDFIDFFNDLHPYQPNLPMPLTIQIDVSNLWRLQAQSGVFLYTPISNLEEVEYDMDRIVFPYTKDFNTISEEEIYPARKSQLEILLDQYFMNEKLIEGTKWIKENNMMPNSLYIESTDFNMELLKKTPSKLLSWEQTNINKWVLNNVNEKWNESYDKSEVTLNIDISLELEEIKKDLVSQLINILSKDKTRSILMKWTLKFIPESDEHKHNEGANKRLWRLWDGLRNLPFTDEQIALSMANLIIIILSIRKNYVNRESEYDFNKLVLHIIPDAMEVEFGANDGSYSRAFVSSKKLLKCVREDIGEIVIQAVKNIIDSAVTPTPLLQAIKNPAFLFDYDKLNNLFVEEVVPTQVIMRTDSAVYYCPAQISAFGLP